MHPYVHSSIIHNSLDMETNEMSINRWTVKEEVVPIYKGMILHRTKEWNNVICSNTDATRVSDVSQRKTNAIKYHLYVESKIWHK